MLVQKADGSFSTVTSDVLNLKQRYLKVSRGKTRFARRNIPLTESAWEVVKRRSSKAKGPYLFPHRSDANRPQDNIDRGHHLAVSDAKIEPGFRLYDFRHTFGSRSAMAGVDLATLKELMGHSSITTTMRYASDSGAQTQRRREVGEIQHRTGLCSNRRKGVPTKVPTVTIRNDSQVLVNC